MGKFPIKKGTFLVATPGLVDPNFAKTVILVCEHNKDGTMGLIVNRPTTITLARILPEELVPKGIRVNAFQGGPVQTDHLLFLHGLEKPGIEQTPVCKGVYLGGTPEALQQALTSGSDPSAHVRCFLGYSGWGPGQLENEMKEGAWIVKPASAPEVFAGDPASLWNRLMGLGAYPFSIGPVSGPDLN